MGLPKLGLGIVLLVWAIFTVCSVLFCYFYAVSVDHLYPLVPSISNTGAREPEGNVFAEAMNVSSSICLVIMTFRYFQLLQRAGALSDNLQRTNVVSLLAGLGSGFGITLVANFPSTGRVSTRTSAKFLSLLLEFYFSFTKMLKNRIRCETEDRRRMKTYCWYVNYI